VREYLKQGTQPSGEKSTDGGTDKVLHDMVLHKCAYTGPIIAFR